MFLALSKRTDRQSTSLPHFLLLATHSNSLTDSPYSFTNAFSYLQKILTKKLFIFYFGRTSWSSSWLDPTELFSVPGPTLILFPVPSHPLLPGLPHLLQPHPASVQSLHHLNLPCLRHLQHTLKKWTIRKKIYFPFHHIYSVPPTHTNKPGLLGYQKRPCKSNLILQYYYFMYITTTSWVPVFRDKVFKVLGPLPNH